MDEVQQSISENPIKPKKDRALASLILGIIGILAWIFPLVGFPVTIIGLVFGINSLKGKRRGMAITGIILCAIFLLATSINSIIGAYKGATGQLGQTQDDTSASKPKGIENLKSETQEETAVVENPKSETPQWNTSDLNIETNGNVAIALTLLKDMTEEQLRQNAVAADSELVMKAPWQYYGKVLKFSGITAIVQDYPPNSDVANSLNEGKEVGEIVFLADDAAMTPIDYLCLNSTGDLKVDEYVTVYGFVVGQVEVDNELGGKTTQLAVIGKAFDKQSNMLETQEQNTEEKQT